ncbi:hypothetical protein C0995_001118 [Termitomyces sp. Mi166|nr:hypothetical protein C0995_001118 [Termitomyces sp. Mi166\
MEADRGRDSTVTAAHLSSTELEDNIRKLLGCNEDISLLKVSVDKTDYIISKTEILGSTSPIGRSTRCIKAFSPERNGLVLLKDSWRVLSPTLKPEHEIYKKLHDSNVTNIPKAYHGADIGDDDHHTTQTKLWLDKTANPLGLMLRTHRHYRIVLEYLEFTLEEFEVTREMIEIVRDASIAHAQAASSAKVLHRDISNGNIMFKWDKDNKDKVQGYLIDWDLSLDLALSRDGSPEAQPERTGTWQFLAIRLLEPNQGESVVQDRIDDVESFYHLLLWMALRYTAHTLTSRNLTVLLHQNFDASYQDPETGEYSIGRDTSFVARRQREAAELAKDEYLKTLANPQWLPDFLREVLDNKNIDWEANAGRVNHKLGKPSKFVPSNLKRKAESSLHSEGSRKVSRKSGTTTPQDNRSGPN